MMIQTRLALPAALLLAWMGLSATANAEPESEVFDDWAVRCVEREALPPCDIVQFAMDRDSGAPVMQFSVAHAGHDDSYGIQLMVPLGVRLPGGVAIRVDGGPPLEDFDFTRCEPSGCFIERVVSEDQLAPFEAGQAGILAVIGRAGEPLVFPLSFKGFTKALDTMTARNRDWAG